MEKEVLNANKIHRRVFAHLFYELLLCSNYCTTFALFVNLNKPYNLARVGTYVSCSSPMSPLVLSMGRWELEFLAFSFVGKLNEELGKISRYLNYVIVAKNIPKKRKWNFGVK